MLHDEWLLRGNIEHLSSLMSDQNLQLLPDYEQRVAVLRDMGFIDKYNRIELKGKVACEVNMEQWKLRKEANFDVDKFRR